MTREEVLNELKGRFGGGIVALQDKSPKRVYADIRPEALVPMARYLFRALGARFNIASGVDTRHDIEILYHFTLEDMNLIVSLRVRLAKSRGVRGSWSSWVSKVMMLRNEPSGDTT